PFPLAQPGPLARTVRDAAAFLDVVAGHEPGDVARLPQPDRPFVAEASTPPGRLRIAVTVEPPLEHPVETSCAAAARDAAALLAELGHDVVEATPPWREHALLERFG